MRKRCFGLLETIIVLIITLILAYLFLHHYKANIFGDKLKKSLYENDIDSSSPSALIQGAEERVNAINRKTEQTQAQIDGLLR